jgi:hypothetical protein
MRRHTLLLITNILIFSSTVVAGKVNRGFQALEVYNYFKAKKLFEKSMDRNPLIAGFGLSIIYSRNDNPFYNLDSAKKYIRTAILTIDSMNTSQQKRLSKLSFTYQSVDSLEKIINQKKFEYALNKNSIREYNYYIQNYTDAKQLEAVISLRNELAFEQAKNTGTPEAYYMFLEKYPNSAQRFEAKANYELSLFKTITASDSIESYLLFLEEYPDSPFSNRAQDIIYEKVTADGKLSSYIEFVQQYNNNRNRNAAWRNVYKLYTKDFSAEKIAEFRLDFPNYPYMDELMTDFNLAGKRFYPVQKDSRYGYIDSSGNVMLDFSFKWAGLFTEGAAVVQEEVYLGMINKQGEFLIPPIYDEIEPFSNGVAIVGLNEKYGLINKLNQQVTPLIYDQISPFSDGLALTELNGKFGYINESGSIKIPIIYDAAGSFSNGFAYAEQNGKKGLINLNGDVVVGFDHDWIEVFNKQGVARARKDNKYGIYASNGSLIVDFIYSNIGEFSNGYALVADSTFYTFVNTFGTSLTKFAFQFKLEALSFSKFDKNGFAPVITKDKIGIIDTTGEKVVPAIFEAIGDYNPSGLTAIKKKGNWGYMNADTRLIIPYKFTVAEPFINEKAIVRTNVGFTVINNEGKPLLNDDYTYISRLDSLGFILEKNEDYQLVDHNFVPILKNTYQGIKQLEGGLIQLNANNSVEIYDPSLKKIIWK